MHKHNIIQYIKLVNIKYFILPEKVPCMFGFGLTMYMRIACFLLTMKFFQVCAMCAIPCYKGISYLGDALVCIKNQYF